jgi:hypothetical protein
MKKNREKMRHGRAVKTKESHKRRAEKKEKRAMSKVDSLLKFILTRNFDLFNSIMLNYMSSDFNTGEWTPIIPEIHELNPNIPTLRECGDIVVKSCRSDDDNLTQTGKLLYTWLMIPVQSKKKFYNQIANKLFNEDGSAKAHDPEVWSFSEKVKNILTLTLDRYPNSQDPVSAAQVPTDINTFIKAVT